MKFDKFYESRLPREIYVHKQCVRFVHILTALKLLFKATVKRVFPYAAAKLYSSLLAE